LKQETVLGRNGYSRWEMPKSAPVLFGMESRNLFKRTDLPMIKIINGLKRRLAGRFYVPEAVACFG